MYSNRLQGLVLLVVLAACTTIRAESRSAASLLPETTKGYVSVPDLDRLLEAWDDTQFGQLFADPRLQPFVEQILDKLRGNGTSLQLRLGVALDDLAAVSGGELCLAAMEPDGEGSHATVVIVNTAGRVPQTRVLLEQVRTALAARNATQQALTIHGRQVTDYTVPGQHGTDHHVYYALDQQTLIATDHLEAMQQILARRADASLPALEDEQAFQVVLQRTKLDGQNQSHVNWYVEPFGYARVLRAAIGQRKRGADMLKILQSQGFAALEAVGGHVALRTREHELLHRTLVYAPTDRELAARVLDFPSGSALEPVGWIPANIANYVSFRWRMRDAFEHSASLVNAVAKSEGFFEEFLGNLEQDPNGPQVNLRRDLMAHLGERVTFISDTQLPVTPKSDRFMVAIELTDAQAVARTVAQALQADPTAKSQEINGVTVWEIVNQTIDEDLELTIDVEVDGAKFNFGNPRARQEVVEEVPPTLPNSAIAVVHGHLLVASHVDLIVQIIHQAPLSPSESLSLAADYQRVSTALAKLSSGNESFRILSRSDETYHATYELIRQGRVGESESLVARLLNRLNGEKGTAKHAQRIDGSQLPEFDYVRRYLGPAGALVESEADGWIISGFVLSNQVD